MAKKTKSGYFTPLTEEQIVKAVEAIPQGGAWRKVEYIHEIADIDGDEIVVTFTPSCRIKIRYDAMKVVKEAKAKAEARLGTKPHYKSSYIHLKDEDGNLVDPIYIVRNKKDITQKSLQLKESNQHKIIIDEYGKKQIVPYPIMVKYYRNGTEIDPAVETTVVAKLKATPVNKTVWVIPFDKVLNIK